MRIVQARALDGRKLSGGGRLHGRHGTGNGYRTRAPSLSLSLAFWARRSRSHEAVALSRKIAP